MNLNMSEQPNQSGEVDSSEGEQHSVSHGHQNEVEIEVKKTKVHGCTWPLHIYQVFTWVLGTFETFYLF